MQLEKDIFNLYVKLKTFQIIYNHSEIYDFVNNNFLARQRATSSHHLLQLGHKQMSLPDNLCLDAVTDVSSPAKQSHDGGILEWIMQRIVVKGCAELWNVSLLMKLDDQHIAMSVSHTRFLLEQIEEKRSSRYRNKFLNLLLNQRQWNMELMVETLWSNLGNSNNDTNNLKKTHSPGSPFFLGVSLVKLCSYANTTKLDISIHTFRTEYSMQLAEFVVMSMLCIKQYGGLSNKRAKQTPKPIISTPEDHQSIALRVSVKVKDITAYFVNHHNVFMLLSFSEMSLSRSQYIATLKLEELQMAIMRSMTASSLCLTDFSDFFASCKMIRLEHEQQPDAEDSLGKLSIYIPSSTEAMWNSNLHMHLLTLVRDMQDLKTELAMPPKTNPEPAPHKPRRSLIIELSADNNTVCELKLSERHSIQFLVQNFFFSNKDLTIIYAENVLVRIDDQHIFTVKELKTQSRPHLEVLTAERQNFPGFVLPTNKVWETTIGSFKAIFPYDHDFYDAINNEFVTHFKWLKLVHNYKKKPFTVHSPLPSDLVIRIKEFLLEISDDPFEVKLRDNYVLLVDEYLESLKRKALFDKKIAELCSERLILPAGTIENLNANLVKKNSEIYIQRSKKIHESGPVRTRLLAWIMTDVEILAMADTSIHGYDNVTRTMREIDSESPWPEEGLQFTTLWCRGVNISCSEWKFMLR